MFMNSADQKLTQGTAGMAVSDSDVWILNNRTEIWNRNKPWIQWSLPWLLISAFVV